MIEEKVKKSAITIKYPKLFSTGVNLETHLEFLSFKTILIYLRMSRYYYFCGFSTVIGTVSHLNV